MELSRCFGLAVLWQFGSRGDEENQWIPAPTSYEGIEVKLRFPILGELRFSRHGSPSQPRILGLWVEGGDFKLRREPHIVKSAVYACQRRSRGPGQCGCGQAGTAPHKVSPDWNFREGQIPCSGIRIPCSGSNSALKFPARLRREFCKKTMQYQRISHTPFA